MHVPPSASTRLRAPSPVADWVARPRINALIDARPDARLVLIHGPAGFGKSTLAAQRLEVLRSRGARAAWLSLDADDDRTLWFLSHLIECLYGVHPDLEPTLPKLLEERPDDAEDFLLPQLINHVDAADRPTVVVLDDWHLISSERTREVFARLLRHSSPQLSFIVTSRSTNGLPLELLRVREQLVEVSPDELRFDQEEAQRFLNDVKQLSLSREQVEKLYFTTEGWVAALQLSSLSLRGNADVAGLLASLDTRRDGVGAYLAENVFDQLEPDLLDFLLRTCIVDRLERSLASALTGDAAAADTLEHILRRDLFLQRLDETGQWFRYHHLFSQFLRQRLEREQPALIPQLHMRAAQWFTGQGMVVEAVNHAIAAGDEGFALDIVDEHAPLLVEHSQMSTLLALVDKLPADLLRTRPRLQLALSWAYCLLHFSGKATAELAALEASLAAAQQMPAEQRFQLERETLVVRRCLDMYADRVPDDDELAADVLECADRLEPWAVSVAANVLTFFEIYRNHSPQGTALQHWAQPWHQRVTGSFSRIYGDCFAGLIAFQDLDIPAAHHHWERAYREGRNVSGERSHAALLAGGLLGKLHYQRGDFETAEKLFVDALKLGQRAGVVDFTIPPYEMLARIRAHRGDLAGAEEVLAAGEHTGRELDLSRLWMRMARVRAELGLPCPLPRRRRCDQAHQRACAEAELLRMKILAVVQPDASRCGEAPGGWVRGGEASSGEADGSASGSGTDAPQTSGGSAGADGEAAGAAQNRDADSCSAPAADSGSHSELIDQARRLIADSENQHNALQALRDRLFLAALLQHSGQQEEALQLVREAASCCADLGLCAPLLDAPGDVRVLLARLEEEGARLPERSAGFAAAGDALSAAQAGTRAGHSGTGLGAGSGGRSADRARRSARAGEHSAPAGSADSGSAEAATDPAIDELQGRDLEILQLLARGLSNRDIAGELFLSINTVKWHLRRLYRRMGANDREGCVALARSHGLLKE